MALSIDFTGKHVFVFGGTTGINFAHRWLDELLVDPTQTSRNA